MPRFSFWAGHVTKSDLTGFQALKNLSHLAKVQLQQSLSFSAGVGDTNRGNKKFFTEGT